MTRYPMHPVLIVDDELEILKSFDVVLRGGGINNIMACQDSRDVMPILSSRKIEAILLDLTMPHITGEKLLPMITLNYPDIPVIVITGSNELEMAVRCMKDGAYDYMVKPVERNRLVSGVQRAVDIRTLQEENLALKDRMLKNRLEYPGAFSDIITKNKSMLSLFQYAESISESPYPVLITGETGVGKELMARAIHLLSKRSGEFVCVNVAGIDDSAFSDTLFGHLKGAFTGAVNLRKGLVDRAFGGTLLLDEIGDLNPESQVKLLRLLQEKQYFPLGSDLAKMADARIIVTTNQDLKRLQESGDFRKDLYFRLHAHAILIPPLRERLDDLPLLTAHFIEKASRLLGKKTPTPPGELIDLLSNYHFPGNIRELEAMICDAVSFHRSKVLSLERFRIHIDQNRPHSEAAFSSQAFNRDTFFEDAIHLPTIEEANRLLFEEAMKRCNNNQSIAASLLGISRQRLARHLKTFS